MLELETRQRNNCISPKHHLKCEECGRLCSLNYTAATAATCIATETHTQSVVVGMIHFYESKYGVNVKMAVGELVFCSFPMNHMDPVRS